MKTNYLILLLFTGILFTTSCEEIDNLSGGASAPEVTYASTTYDATFFMPGQTGTPTIDWNGDQGTVSLGSAIDGVSVNATTGQVRWTKTLPAGTHEVEVILSNAEGQVVVPIVIENPLQGRFEGVYDDAIYYALIFKTDGTVDVEVDNPDNPYEGNGTYELLPNGTISAEYEYEHDPGRPIQITGEFDQSGSEAVLKGDWESASLSGTYLLSLQ